MFKNVKHLKSMNQTVILIFARYITYHSICFAIFSEWEMIPFDMNWYESLFPIVILVSMLLCFFSKETHVTIISYG